MNKSKIMIAVFAVVAAAVSARAEGTMENLTGATDKISSIDMKKNFSEAGNILGGFYSGSSPKAGSDTPVVYAEQGNSQAPKQAEKDVCNAKPSKIGKLGAKVKPLAETAATALQSANKSTWLEDLDTVTDYVTHVGGHAVETVDAINAGNGVDPDEVGIVHGIINTIDAAVNP